jgi:hypothetical protein
MTVAAAFCYLFSKVGKHRISAGALKSFFWPTRPHFSQDRRTNAPRYSRNWSEPLAMSLRDQRRDLPRRSLDKLDSGW